MSCEVIAHSKGVCIILALIAALLCAPWHQAAAATTERVSVASDGTQADDSSREPSISADGRMVAFQSNSTNLAGGSPNLSLIHI